MVCDSLNHFVNFTGHLIKHAEIVLNFNLSIDPCDFDCRARWRHWPL